MEVGMKGSGDRSGLWQETGQDLVVHHTAKQSGQHAEDSVVNIQKKVGAYCARAK